MFSSNTTQVSDGGYQIQRSLRFNSADSAYLNRTPASAGNRRTWTWSGWVKKALVADNNPMLFTAGSGSPYDQLYFDTNDKLNWYTLGVQIFLTNAVYRDPSAWYHIVLSVDTTQATGSDRVKLYVNNVAQTFSTYNAPSINQDTATNSAVVHNIGRLVSALYYFNGYMTEVNFIDGQALTPSSFGETNAQTGVWQPKAYSGSYGTNGFYLNFSDNSNTTAATLGKDYSGNGNNWTPNNFSVTAGAGNDSVVDSPTAYGFDTGVGGTVRGNYCTLNPLTTTAGTYTQGNLQYAGPNSWRRSNATISRATGQWYWEVTLANAPYPIRANGEWNAFGFGLSTVFDSTATPPLETDAVILTDSGYYKNFSGSYTDTGVAFASGDVLSIAVDLDANTFTFRRNNTSLATGTIGGTAGRELVPIILSYNGQYGLMDCNFGQRPFAYTAPSGYKALCTQNLPTPTIGATSTTLATSYFNTLLYTGDGTTPRSLTGVGFQPDFVWIKTRSASNGHLLNNAVAGVGSGKTLYTNLTSEQGAYDQYGYLASLNSDGFTTQAGSTDSLLVNASGSTFVAWNWKANGSGSTNTAGSITSTVSANTTSGFSVVTYTGTGNVGTVGHGLGVAPAMIIVKARGASTEWAVYSQTLGINYVLQLSTTSAAISVTNKWSGTNSSVFGVNSASDVNGGSVTYVAYCFAEVAGYSKFGSYTGNGSTDGPFVFTGMRPAYVMFKRTDASSNWYVFDVARNTSNVMSNFLCPNDSLAETSVVGIDFLSNGFKQRGTAADYNASGGTYIYMAFASNPFKYSLAR